MSDGMSDSLKPSFWEEFFEGGKTVSKNKKLYSMVEEYNIILELNGVNKERDLIPLKIKIMDKCLKIYSKGYKCEPHYSYMFKESWRWPNDYYLKID